MSAFTDRLKEVRNSVGKTQSEVARDLKISSTGYAGYEQGYREPDFDMLIKICKYFDVTADYMIGLSDNK